MDISSFLAGTTSKDSTFLITHVASMLPEDDYPALFEVNRKFNATFQELLQKDLIKLRAPSVTHIVSSTALTQLAVSRLRCVKSMDILSPSADDEGGEKSPNSKKAESFDTLPRRSKNWLFNLVEAASKYGRVESLRHLKDFGLLQFVIESNTSKANDLCMHGAAASGSVETMKYLIDNGLRCIVRECVIAAAEAGQLATLRYCVTYQGHRGDGMMTDLDVVSMSAKPEQVEMNRDISWIAAAKGHLHILKWALELNRLDGRFASHAAAKAPNHMKILLWLHAMSKIDAYGAYVGAAVCGNVSIAQWLFNNGYEPKDLELPEGGSASSVDVDESGNLCHVAARSWHFEMVKWLQEHGCGWGICTVAKIHVSIDRENWFALEAASAEDVERERIRLHEEKLQLLELLEAHGCPLVTMMRSL